MSHPKPLQERIAYFDPSQSLEAELKSLMQKESLHPASMDEIKQENFLRYLIGKQLLTALRDPDLQSLVQKTLPVRPALII